MSGKSRRRKGRFQPQVKRKKARQSRPLAVSQPVVAPLAEEAVVATPQVAAASPAPVMVKNPEVVAELRRIGILAGAMVAVLIILALVLG
jgi:hypothetical protein